MISRNASATLLAVGLALAACGSNELGTGANADSGIDAAGMDAGARDAATDTSTDSPFVSPDLMFNCDVAPSAELLATARAWLEAPAGDRAGFEDMLRAYNTCIDGVVHELRPHAWAAVAPGDYWDQTYVTPELYEKQGDHLFHFHVPSFYTPDTPIGLAIWMHGGGSHDEGDWPWVRQNMHPWEGGKRCYARPELDEAPFILVVPIAPFGHLLPAGAEGTLSRWNVIGADTYLMDLIDEFQNRFNIDTNRVVLAGHSMGGFGANHQVFRLADRVAAVFSSAGGWAMGPFEALRYTPFYIHQGTHDSYWNSASDYRWHGTDIAFARLQDEILTGLDIDHVFWEYDGGHGWTDPSEDPVHSGELGWTEFVNDGAGWVADKVRDPYRADVVAVNPRTSYLHGEYLAVTWDETPTPDTMWLTIRQIGSGTIPFDVAEVQHDGDYSTYDAWATWNLNHTTEAVRGGMIHGHNAGNNTFELTTDNVDELSLWLHPVMADPSRPVHVSVNGVSRDYTCNPTLLDALRSYERRRDWNMSYQCEIQITVADHH